MSCVVGSVAVGGAGLVKWLWELFWWKVRYWCGRCYQMVMGAVLVGL